MIYMQNQPTLDTHKFKKILPKGCEGAGSTDSSKTIHSIYTPPGTTIVVIPSSTRPLVQGKRVHLKGVKTLTSLKGTSTFFSSHFRDKEDKNGENELERSGLMESEKLSVVTSRVKDDKMHKESKQMLKTKAKNTEVKNGSLSSHRNDDVFNDDPKLFSRGLQGTIPANECANFEEPNIAASATRGTSSNLSVKTRPSSGLPDLPTCSPPPYEQYISSSYAAVDQCSRLVTSLPPSYNQCRQSYHQYLTTSGSLQSNRIENNTAGHYANQQLPAEYMDTSENFEEAPFISTESSVPSNYINYYDSPYAERDCRVEASRQSSQCQSRASTPAQDYRYDESGFISNAFCLDDLNDDDEPRDYSSNSVLAYKKRTDDNFLNNPSVGVEFRRNSGKVAAESSYEERRKLASSLLNVTDSKRKKTLKDNFWIVEDEPLKEDLFVKDKEETQANIPSTINAATLKLQTSKQFVCHVCGKMLRGRSSLRSHVHLHSNVKPYECHYCNRRFTQSSTLKNHLRTHTGETPYSCESCGRSFTTQSILRKHMTKHSKVRAFKCCVCSRAFRAKASLQNHVKLHLLGPHSCRVCNTLFDTRRSLATHVQRKHKNQKRFVCPICSKGYWLNCLLKQHMNVHTNEKKYSCYVCGASYVWRSGLAAHLKTHSFKIQCEICGVRLVSLKKLEKHRSRHSDQFAHKCSKCEKQFKFSYLLKKHVAKHKDELSCVECGIGFVTKTNHKRHLKMHTQR